MPSDIMSYMNTTFAGNELWRFFAFFVALLLSLAAGKIVQVLLARTANRLDRIGRASAAVTISALGRSVTVVSFSLGFKLAIGFLTLSTGMAGAAESTTAVLVSLSVGYIAYCLIDVVDHRMRMYAGKTESKLDDMLVPMVRTSLRVTVVVMTVLQVAQALTSRPLTSLVAGLGVGGLAVALASQDAIKNFFGSLIIFADKPFTIGDRVVVDGFDGPIEEVGFRSTRIRTLEGHLVTIPNGELANKNIQNIGRRPYIRQLMNIGITYNTPPEKVARAKTILTEILDNHEGMRPDFPPRVYFNQFNDWSLNLLVIFWYHPPDYWKFMDFAERVNTQILERFNAEGISFAFPTSTVHVEGLHGTATTHSTGPVAKL